MKKAVVLILSLVLVSSMFSVEVIRFISSDDFAQFRKEAIVEFEKMYPDIKVEMTTVGYNQLYQKEITSLIADPAAFDVIDVDCIWVPEYVALNLLEPVDDKLTQEMKEGIIPSAMRIMQYDGKTFGLPMFDDVLFFYYNKKMLEECGISNPPKTWDEFIEVSQLLQKEGIVKYGSIFGLAQAEGLICYYTMMLGTFGGEFFDEQGYPIFNQGGGLKALEWMVDAIYEHKILDPASITSDDRNVIHSLANGDVAFIFDWSFAWSIFNDPEQSTQVGNIGVALVPSGSEEIVSCTSSGSMGLGISRGSKHKEASWRFIEFLASKEMQKQQAIKYGAMPIWIELYSDPEVLEEHPEFEEMCKQFDYVMDRPSLVPYNEFSRILQVYIQNALVRKLTPQEALNIAAKETEKMLKEYQLIK